jgi:hypothetical protein
LGTLRRRLAALTLSTGLGLLVAELAVRATVGTPLVERLPLVEVEAHATRGWRMVPSMDHRTYHHEVRVNALGLRGREVPEERAPGELRVLALGDSTTYGQGVADGDTLPAAMEAELRALSSDRAWRVINAGHRGYATNQELALLRELGPSIDPDVVLLLWFENDLEDIDVERNHARFLEVGRVPFDLGEPWTRGARLRWHATQLLRRSALLMELHDRLQQARTVPRSAEEERRGLERAAGHLDELVALCREGDRLGVVAVVPHPGVLSGPGRHGELAGEVLRLARERGLATLDLAPALLEHARRTEGPTVLPFDGHYDGAANRAMARSAARQLLETPGLEPR